ncbi:SGNH/GDSL hydrolase family protein [Nocardioides panacis]|uniref:SGNH/GDSL hydrolase family protein n=1 Tax=Nocardioides panacis TaxID=2849501 RepID=A0A975T0L2_9ACTN|nr:SGNH/GDSL hydrolase family protein [Nocardioides panacis]QWZ08850.1 SGNH/GDSL hydrolase family protein [Nocardioides panacis]
MTGDLRRAGGLLVSASAVASVGAWQLLRAQARTARAAIGKPLGEAGFQVDRTYQRSRGRPLTLLVLGDSIAAGLGADRRRQTLGVRLAKELARAADRSVRLVCSAEVGAETWQLACQLDRLPGDVRPDVTVVVVGGNDVIHRVRLADSVRHLEVAVRALRARGSQVVVGTCPDLGALHAVPQPLRQLGRQASRRLALAQREAVVRCDGYAVSLAHVVGPVFLSRPEEMFAADRFHPSAAGYRRTARALLPSVLAGLGLLDDVPAGHHRPGAAPDGAVRATAL